MCLISAVTSRSPATVALPSTCKLSLTSTVPPVESNVKLPEDVVISLSASTPSRRLSI